LEVHTALLKTKEASALSWNGNAHKHYCDGKIANYKAYIQTDRGKNIYDMCKTTLYISSYT
jgi:hypothetical protein